MHIAIHKPCTLHKFYILQGAAKLGYNDVLPGTPVVTVAAVVDNAQFVDRFPQILGPFPLFFVPFTLLSKTYKSQFVDRFPQILGPFPHIFDSFPFKF